MLENQAGAGADALGDHLAQAGFRLVVVDVGAGESIPDLGPFAALLVLGGEMNVWQEDAYPWLVEEKAVIRAWMEGPLRPLLGICLGHQLLADALGGDVGSRRAFEVGVQRVHLTSEGEVDPILGRLGSTFSSLQWHGAEVRRVPDGAVVLASNDTTSVQAMRVGSAAWGVQFHPEVGPARAAEWGADPTFQSLLDVADGPGGAARFPPELELASEAMATITAGLALAFAAQIDGLRASVAGERLSPLDCSGYSDWTQAQ